MTNGDVIIKFYLVDQIQMKYRQHMCNFIPDVDGPLEMVGEIYSSTNSVVFRNETTEYMVSKKLKKIPISTTREEMEAMKEKWGISNSDRWEIIRIYCIATQREFSEDNMREQLFYSRDWQGFVGLFGWPTYEALRIGAKWWTVVLDADWWLTTWTVEGYTWDYLPIVEKTELCRGMFYFI